MKKCSTCGEQKPASDFPPNRRKCRPCVAQYLSNWKQQNPHKIREYALIKDFGITHEEYIKMHEAQKGLCGICGEPETIIMYGKQMDLAVDHDHKTGEVRGLLCANCNNGLGRFKDNVDLLKKAIEYIEKGRP